MRILPQKIEDVRKKKELFMRLLTESQEQVKEYEQAISHCDRLTARIVEKRKRRIYFFPAFLVLLCLCLMFGGCNAGFGLGVDGSLFYPNVPGKFEDPAESRRQTTQHTTNMARNNLPLVGENK